jgi:hypothetical protein
MVGTLLVTFLAQIEFFLEHGEKSPLCKIYYADKKNDLVTI